MRFYRTLLNQETGLWPLQIESNRKLFYIPWTVKDRTLGPALTHWGRVTHICVSRLTTIGSDNGLPPGRRQAIIWSNAGILLNWTLIRNRFQWNLKRNWYILFKQMRLKMSSGKWRPYCLGLNVLTHWGWDKMAAIFQTTFSNRFSGMKMYEFRLTFHWSLFLEVQLTILQHCFR